MSWQRRGKPYIRRAKPNDYAPSLRTVFRMAHLDFKYGFRAYFVLVQHGHPHEVLQAGRTKEEIKFSILVVSLKKKRFKEWQRSVHAATGLGKYVPSSPPKMRSNE